MNQKHRISVEDEAIDVLQKAIFGLTSDRLIKSEDFQQKMDSLQQQILGNCIVDTDWLDLASELHLHPPSLLRLAKKPTIDEVLLPTGWNQWTLPFGPYSVNSYCFSLQDQQCVLIDAGFQVSDFMERLQKSALQPVAILITHNHRDHVGALTTLIEKYPDLVVYAMDQSLCRHCLPINDGDRFELKNIEIRIHHTPGHAIDGVAFEIANGESVAVAGGDTIYARSAGKIPHHYKKSLRILEETILNLPNETLILPGHGPVTTVGEERRYNPFFAK